jgi:hypothetical protein
MLRRFPLRAALLAAAASSFALVACSDDSNPTAIRTGKFGQFNLGETTTPNAEMGKIKICGPVGNSATFTMSAVATGNGTTQLLTPVTVNAGVCEVVATGTGSGNNWSDVTLTQTSPGFLSATAERNGDDNITTESFSNGATILINEHHGWAITFVNTPPGQGCSPGYWKNHTGWPAPYAPNQLFSSVFENAFPGKTLQQVLGLGGGGLNALGRQTVSALLSAQAFGAANYGMSAADVIAAFNGVFPGGDYNTLQSTFGALTDVDGRVCPLG